MQDEKTVPVNSAEVEQKMVETYKNVLKQRAAQYVPQNPNTAEAQRELMEMIGGVLPPVSVIVKSAETQLWPLLKRGEITAVQSAQICTDNIEKLISITKMENLNLRSCEQEKLVKAWAALAYFQRFSRSQSALMHTFRTKIASVLMEMEYSGDTIQDSGKEKTDGGSDSNTEHNTGRRTAEEQNRKKKGFSPVIAGILILVLAIGGFLFYQNSRVRTVQTAIDAIGTVTMESLTDIENAEQLYGGLSESLQGKVENQELLTGARAEYDRLAAKLQEAKDAVNAIGKVSLDSRNAVQKARKAFDALETDGLTSYASEEEKTLLAAEEKYDALYADSLYDSAMEFYDAQEYQKALNIFDNLLIQYPRQNAAGQAKNMAASCQVKLAQASYDAGDYEAAFVGLQKAREDYADSEENRQLQEALEKKLEALRPSNGEVLEKTLTWGYGELSVTAGTHDICYKLVSKTDPEMLVLVYVRAGESKSVKVKNGEYLIYYTSGEHWFGDDVGFGSDASYLKYTGTLNYSTHTEGSYIYYTVYELELYTDTTGNFATASCTANEFWD